MKLSPLWDGGNWECTWGSGMEDVLIRGDGRCKVAGNWDSLLIQQLAAKHLVSFLPLEDSSSVQCDVVQLLLCYCQV